jgi:hypothetical protein
MTPRGVRPVTPDNVVGMTSRKRDAVLMSPATQRMRALALCMFVLAAAVGCSGDDAMPDPLCMEADQHDDLAWLQDNVFTRTCAAFSACHMGNATSAGDLNLEEGMLEENVVNVPSDLADGMDIVEPGSPMDSYMMVILGEYGTDDPRIDQSVGTMPYNNELLCSQKREAIGRWIASLPAAN